jgi:hypothetical protein
MKKRLDVGMEAGIHTKHAKIVSQFETLFSVTVFYSVVFGKCSQIIFAMAMVSLIPTA